MSYNPAGLDDPVQLGMNYGVEVDGTGWFSDTFVQFTTVRPGPNAKVGTTFSVEIKHDISCSKRQQTYQIRDKDSWREVDHVITWATKPPKYFCAWGDPKVDTLTGHMAREKVNGPLRQVPPDEPYPEHPFTGLD